MAYTPSGALTNGGKTYKDMKYDAWGRLVEVRNQSSVVQAAYRYNGVGHRITWQDDADNDADVDGSDPVYHLAYTEDWRMVAVYRGSDANLKERHLPHMAGLNGFGHVGGPDGQILYDKDTSTAWASAADGTLDARRYICQNHRGDVSAIITDIAWQVESIRYTAYGEPTALPGGDTDSDGDFDATDASNIIGWTTGYDARYDVNVDGLIDADDLSDAIAVNGGGYLTSGRGVLSGAPTTNRKGYAGAEHDRVMPARLAHVRHRAYRADLGRWVQPDPMEFVDGVNRWGYVSGDPISGVDSAGLCATGTCAGMAGAGSPRPSRSRGCGDRNTDGWCCCVARKMNLHRSPGSSPGGIFIPGQAPRFSEGFMICCNGRKVACIGVMNIVRPQPSPGPLAPAIIPDGDTNPMCSWDYGVDRAIQSITDCVLRHEQGHFGDTAPCPANGISRPPFRHTDNPEDFRNRAECREYAREYECLQGALAKCAALCGMAEQACRNVITEEIAGLCQNVRHFCDPSYRDPTFDNDRPTVPNIEAVLAGCKTMREPSRPIRNPPPAPPATSPGGSPPRSPSGS